MTKQLRKQLLALAGDLRAHSSDTDIRNLQNVIDYVADELEGLAAHDGGPTTTEGADGQ